MPETQKITIGRRKRATARIILRPGSGNVEINDKPLVDYFPQLPAQLTVLQPLQLLDLEDQYDIYANVEGGGWRGQCEAIRMGVARYLVEIDPSTHSKLKDAGFLTRDDREVERKKYGHKKARKRPQFSKR